PWVATIRPMLLVLMSARPPDGCCAILLPESVRRLTAAVPRCRHSTRTRPKRAMAGGVARWGERWVLGLPGAQQRAPTITGDRSRCRYRRGAGRPVHLSSIIPGCVLMRAFTGGL